MGRSQSNPRATMVNTIGTSGQSNGKHQQNFLSRGNKMQPYHDSHGLSKANFGFATYSMFNNNGTKSARDIKGIFKQVPNANIRGTTFDVRHLDRFIQSGAAHLNQ